jgi:hypothetical protein
MANYYFRPGRTEDLTQGPYQSGSGKPSALSVPILKVTWIKNNAEYQYFDVEFPKHGWYSYAISDGSPYIPQFQALINSKGGKMFNDVKKYISDNKDTIYTILFVALLDQVFFGGAFKTKLETMTHNFLDKKSTTTGS